MGVGHAQALPPGRPGLPQSKAAWPRGLTMRMPSEAGSPEFTGLPVPIQHLLTEISNPLITHLPAGSSLPASPTSPILFSKEQAAGQAREETHCLIIQRLLRLDVVPLINIKPRLGREEPEGKKASPYLPYPTATRINVWKTLEKEKNLLPLFLLLEKDGHRT